MRGLLTLLFVFVLILSGAMPAHGLQDDADGVARGVALYEQGDYDGARAAWEPLAQDGNRAALFNMGQMYRLGRGVPADADQAMAYYQRAADLGYPIAQQVLATMIYYKDGATQEDLLEASNLWHRAAEQGLALAQYRVAVLYWNGDIIPQNLERAYGWTLLAAAQGLEEAAETELVMRRQLSVPQLAEGRRLSRILARPEHEQVAAGDQLVDPEEGKTARVLAEMPESQEQARPTPAPAETPVPPEPEPMDDDLNSLGVRTPPALADASEPTDREPPAADTATRSAPAQVRQAGTAAEAARKWRAQIGAYSSIEAAQSQWATLQAEAPDLIGSAEPLYEAVDVGARTLYRLRLGWWDDREDLRRLCTGLQTAGFDCVAIAP